MIEEEDDDDDQSSVDVINYISYYGARVWFCL